jgi:uncharacterized glyoxalase superfamily protein PhnB
MVEGRLCQSALANVNFSIDAPNFIEFIEKVFGAKEVTEAYTMDTDGLLLHSEFTIGGSRVIVADTKEGWPFIPSLLQIYVEDVEETLQRAEELGARIVTRPTSESTVPGRSLPPLRPPLAPPLTPTEGGRLT